MKKTSKSDGQSSGSNRAPPRSAILIQSEKKSCQATPGTDCKITGMRTRPRCIIDDDVKTGVKRQKVSALDVVLEEPQDGGVAVSMAQVDPTPARPKATVSNAFEAVFLKTPLPQLFSRSASKAPATNPPIARTLKTPMSANQASGARASFLSRMWGKFRGRPSEAETPA